MANVCDAEHAVKRALRTRQIEIQELADTKGQIKAANRQAQLATSLQEQHSLQERIRELEKQMRRQRQRIFDVEDEIMSSRVSGATTTAMPCAP